MTGSRSITRDLLAQACDLSAGGITISDARKPDQPLIYVNSGFECLSGYSAAELLGKNCHFLQGADTDQAEIAVLRAALKNGKDCKVTLRNYRKDGSMFWNELSLTAVSDADGNLTHFIGIQHDITDRILLEQHLQQSHLDARTLNQQARLLVEPQGGISQHFDEPFSRMLQIAQRTRSPLCVLRITPDKFKSYREKYGQSAAQACLRMLGERIAKTYARASDCVALYENEGFCVASSGASVEGLHQHAQKLRAQIRALNIPHSGSNDGVITLCIGGITLIPQRDTTSNSMLESAEKALATAQRRGHDSEELIQN